MAHTGSYLWKGVDLVRHRHAQPEDRLSAHADDRRSDVVHEQPEPDLPLQQRRAEPADRVDLAVGEQRAGRAGTRLFVQEQWTLRRLTLQGALRFDRGAELVPGAAGRAVAIPADADRHSGNARRRQLQGHHAESRARRTTCSGTAGRRSSMNLGKYLEGAGVSGNYANTNPTLRMPQTTSAFGTAGVTRAWTDANRNFVPDCDLLNPAAQDLRASGGDSVRRRVEHELRPERPDQQLRSRDSQRLGRPSVGLEPRRLDSAADRSAVVGRGRVLPAAGSAGSRSSTTWRCSRPI